jgi:hypothetical protein
MPKYFNILEIEKSVLAEVELMFAERKEALAFLKNYVDYIHAVDDLVDEPKDTNAIRHCSTLAAVVFSSDYWVRNKNYLYIVDRLTHNTYFDAVIWEHSPEEWKRRDARALNHCGYNMLFAVVLIEFGEVVLQKFSIKFREYSHLKHINDKI